MGIHICTPGVAILRLVSGTALLSRVFALATDKKIAIPRSSTL